MCCVKIKGSSIPHHQAAAEIWECKQMLTLCCCGCAPFSCHDVIALLRCTLRQLKLAFYSATYGSYILTLGHGKWCSKDWVVYFSQWLISRNWDSLMIDFFSDLSVPKITTSHEKLSQ